MQNDELISRAEAIAEVEQWAEHGYDVIHWTGIKAMLETQPAIDAAPVVHGCIESSDIGPICSVCGVPIRLDQGTPNYCPHCGALLDGGEPTCGPDYCEIGGGDE